jgi:hypothetical protein
VTNTVEVEGTRIITKTIEVPIYIEKIVEKIMMLPQIVEIEKKVYMVETVSSLIAKSVEMNTHSEEYQCLIKTIQTQLSHLLSMLTASDHSPLAQSL